jgi:hypothetical protein
MDALRTAFPTFSTWPARSAPSPSAPSPWPQRILFPFGIVLACILTSSSASAQVESITDVADTTHDAPLTPSGERTAPLQTTLTPHASLPVTDADASGSTGARSSDVSSPDVTVETTASAGAMTGPRAPDEGVNVGRALAVTPTPPPPQNRYLQYGVSLTGEFVTSAGPICTSTNAPCILESGGGFAARVGVRTPGRWLFQGAYELSRHTSGNLFTFATLQQARADVRYYIDTTYATEPFLGAGAGFAGYGDQWGVDTLGATGHLSIGVETQLSRTRVVGFSIGYRLVALQSFFDTADTFRQAGITQMVGLDVILEARDPL